MAVPTKAKKEAEKGLDYVANFIIISKAIAQHIS